MSDNSQDAEVGVSGFEGDNVDCNGYEEPDNSNESSEVTGAVQSDTYGDEEPENSNNVASEVEDLVAEQSKEIDHEEENGTVDEENDIITSELNDKDVEPDDEIEMEYDVDEDNDDEENDNVVEENVSENNGDDTCPVDGETDELNPNKDDNDGPEERKMYFNLSQIISEDEYQFEAIKSEKRRQIHVGPFLLEDLANETLFEFMNSSESFHLHFAKKGDILEGFIEMTMFTEEETNKCLEQLKDFKEGMELYCKGKADIGKIRTRFQYNRASGSNNKQRWSEIMYDEIVVKGCLCDAFKLAENCVVVRKVPEDATETDLKENLPGAIGVIMPICPSTKKHQSFAYVEFSNSDEVKSVVGTEICLRDISCPVNALDKVVSLKEIFEFLSANWIKGAREKNLSLNKEQKSKLDIFLPVAKHYMEFSPQLSDTDRERLKLLISEADKAYKHVGRSISNTTNSSRGKFRSRGQMERPRQPLKRGASNNARYDYHNDKVPKLSDLRFKNNVSADESLNPGYKPRWAMVNDEIRNQRQMSTVMERNFSRDNFNDYYPMNDFSTNRRFSSYDSNLFDEMPNRFSYNRNFRGAADSYRDAADNLTRMQRQMYGARNDQMERKWTKY